ncbi:ubiquitin-conjugating enzyme family protein [Cryptosporidium muris RN66]|uniref:Ubiquitin-conjugating enzyme family protein n=1 Tax=Cryptosporidium muris (strain RN66) TaxID=441375 RepID=B6AJ77_CRYMR|nr:ubiquitin-conjugating enzyme family protein [Cryptosporidium muris RN66]EEA08314.1 ubiquitin-conjugating enzyme family protein [Cryptosporidium muris RN66]|eukprot:XP_002142663.1 ubiquitin-conjugating enzyme family protein [Cryptosporidium muris RN66]
MPFVENMMFCHAIINGPEGTVWESGTFHLIIHFTEEYPTKSPEVRFLSRIYHPNIYPDGRICLDILQNQWSALFDISSILTSIQSLLNDPNPNSPANIEASETFLKNPNYYNSIVLKCVEDSWCCPDYTLPKDV